MNTKPPIEISLDVDSKLASYMYGADGMFVGVRVTLKDGTVYELNFDNASKFGELLNVLNDATGALQAKLFALNQIMHADPDIGCSKTHQLFGKLMPYINGETDVEGQKNKTH